VQSLNLRSQPGLQERAATPMRWSWQLPPPQTALVRLRAKCSGSKRDAADAAGSLTARLRGAVQQGRSAREDFAVSEQLAVTGTAEPSTSCPAEGPCWMGCSPAVRMKVLVHGREE